MRTERSDFPFRVSNAKKWVMVVEKRRTEELLFRTFVWRRESIPLMDLFCRWCVGEPNRKDTLSDWAKERAPNHVSVTK